MRYILWVMVAVAAVALSGCLSESYAIPDDEIERLAQQSPAERSKRVRVVQRLYWEESPRPAAHRHDRGCGHYHNHVVFHTSRYPAPHRTTGQRITKRTRTVIPHGGGGGSRAGSPQAGRPVSGGGGAAGGPKGSRGAPNTGKGSNGRGAQGGPKGGGGGGGNTGTINDGKALAAAVVVGAALFTVGLVATEGKRYDGWVEVEPDHPVHLTYRDGRTEVLPLSNLTPSAARDVRSAVLVDEHAYDFEFAGRAPLSRQGWTWKFEGGAMDLAMPTDGSTSLQPGALMELGYFPTQHLGIVGYLALAGGTHQGADVLGVRYGLGLQLMPLHVGRFHFGAYGMGGPSFDGIEGDDQRLTWRNDLAVGGGALMEVDLTTRLALSSRIGIHVVGPGTDTAVNTMMTTFGVAVY
ncbi:MAG: hypothetical protein AAFX99_34435 [Myxococcota bacterium]